MREFEITFAEALKNGLKAEVSPSNLQVLSQCLGFRCGKQWLEGFDHLTNPLPGALEMHYNWPFPQMLTGEKYRVMVMRDNLMHEDRVYTVSDDHATVVEIFAIDQLTFGQGTIMELADFGRYALMTNGVIFLYYNPTVEHWIPTVNLPNVPMMRTICNFKGQCIGGGILSDWPSAANPQCDETYLVWSDIGSINFTPDRKNEAGFRREPFGGEVLHVRRLGDLVAVYSDKGLSFMLPVQSPAATFGFNEINDVGLLNRGAVNGNQLMQVYVGKDYRIHKVTKGEGDTDLGYQSQMESLADEDVIVSYEPLKKDFYIGNSTKTFLLSPQGLTELLQHPSAVWSVNKSAHMLPAAVDSDAPWIQVYDFDMGYRGEKTIFEMEAGIKNTEGQRMSANDVDYVELNAQNVATQIFSGVDLNLNIKFDEVSSASVISYLKARYKMTDLRNIRGVYAPPPRGQSN